MKALIFIVFFITMQSIALLIFNKAFTLTSHLPSLKTLENIRQLSEEEMNEIAPLINAGGNNFGSTSGREVFERF